MANTRTNRGRDVETESQSSQGESRRGGQQGEGQHTGQAQRQEMQRGTGGRQPMTPYRSGSPFQIMRQMSEDMDRMFERFFGDLGFPRRGLGGATDLVRGGGMVDWRPKIEAYQKEDKFIIRAELPGVSKDDVTVDVSDDAITIHGERRHEQEQEREGLFHSEWSYGSFSRTIPLPEGAIVDNAEASFRDGVLKVTVPAPPHGVRQGRRIEVKEESGR
jgi:HSP20 family protein